MPFVKGTPRPPGAGRKKGVKNKYNYSFKERLQELDFDVLKEIKELLPTLPPVEQMKSLIDLMEFLYPKKRATDLQVSGEIEHYAQKVEELKQLPKEEFIQLAESEIKRLKEE